MMPVAVGEFSKLFEFFLDLDGGLHTIEVEAKGECFMEAVEPVEIGQG